VLIERGQVIVGFDAVVLRSWLKELRFPQSAGVLAGQCAITPAEAEAVLDQLHSAGLVHEVGLTNAGAYTCEGDPPDVAIWTATVEGNAIAKARIGKRMPRAKAEALLAALVERVGEYNADDDRFYDIEWVEVFGSVARGEVQVGDLDVRALATRRFDGDEFQRRRIAALELPSTVVPGSAMDQLYWPFAQMSRFVRGRSPAVDLQLDEIEPRPLPAGSVVQLAFERTPGCRNRWLAAISDR
jgi:hypothetical protein